MEPSERAAPGPRSVEAARALRLFFAARPPAATAAALHRWAIAAAKVAGQGQVVPAENLHLTLAFLGAVPAERLAAAMAAGRRVRGTAHALTLKQTRYWPRSHIVFARPARTPTPLATLAADLHAQLMAGVSRSSAARSSRT